MFLKNNQRKFVECKPIKNIILRGKSNNGKREALLNRILYLVNNFAFEINDRIIFILKNKNDLLNIIQRYEKINGENKYNYFSLLNMGVQPEFITLQDLISKNLGCKKIIEDKDKKEILQEKIFKEKEEKYKKINEKNAYIILNEIKYMKNHRITNFQEYNMLKGTPLRLRRNSFIKKEMYSLFMDYNEELEKMNYIDYEDLLEISIKKLNKGNNKYVHVLIDNAGEFSKLELDYLLSLREEKSYSTLTLSVDTDKNENVYSDLVKKGRIYYKKYFKDNKKVFNFKDILDKKANDIRRKNIIEKSKDEFIFKDLKHRKEFMFTLENIGEKESLVSEDNTKFDKNDLQEIPVFNNIAAGEPILINPEVEGTFNIPKYWIKGSDKKFILKVKGDSMIGAGINNGDLVVIEQNPSPMNGDIVAVNLDGNATLKRLKIEKDKIILLPENKIYKPIIVSKYDEFYILGKAIGVISKKGNDL